MQVILHFETYPPCFENILSNFAIGKCFVKIIDDACTQPAIRQHLIIKFFICKVGLFEYFLEDVHGDVLFAYDHCSYLLDYLAIKFTIVVFESFNH
jgi:cytochrome c oxidase subunit IV